MCIINEGNRAMRIYQRLWYDKRLVGTMQGGKGCTRWNSRMGPRVRCPKYHGREENEGDGMTRFARA